MKAFEGFHVSILLPVDPDDNAGFTHDHLREMVDRLDPILVHELVHNFDG